MRARIALYMVVVCLCSATILSAQDPTKVDSKHYTTVSDNAYSRIVKAHYEPHDKSVMHSHPDLVAVFLTDGKVKFSYPDGKTEEREVKAGDAMFTPATVHLPENVGDKAFDVILVEFKGKAPAKHAAKPAPKAEGKK
ncbi:MAG TPA: cupin domain-containing protein [Candidatus Angelobacter sp.]|nr:cupin domain-containing protein [Candidatus Angelobacter sp.]